VFFFFYSGDQVYCARRQIPKTTSAAIMCIVLDAKYKKHPQNRNEKQGSIGSGIENHQGPCSKVYVCFLMSRNPQIRTPTSHAKPG